MSRPFWRWTCPARKWSPATAPRAAAWRQAYPQAHFLGTQGQRRARRSLCIGGRVRVSEPHRHFRHGAARSAGLRPAGRGAAGAGAARRDRRRAAPACSTWICAPLASRRSKFRATKREPTRLPSPGRKARASFSTIFCSPNPPRRALWPCAPVSEQCGGLAAFSREPGIDQRPDGLTVRRRRPLVVARCQPNFHGTRNATCRQRGQSLRTDAGRHTGNKLDEDLHVANCYQLANAYPIKFKRVWGLCRERSSVAS